MRDTMGNPPKSAAGAPDAPTQPPPVENEQNAHQDEAGADSAGQTTLCADGSVEPKQLSWEQTRLRYPALGMCRR